MEVTVIKSNRKTISIQINPDLSVTLRVPKRTTQKDIVRVIKEKETWINKHIQQMKERQAQFEEKEPEYLTNEEVQELADKALKIIPERVAYYAPIVGVDYGRITIRNQKTRWGSCSGKGNLNFNCLLMLTPDSVIDYVVVHELCHRKEMNHSKVFWNEVAKVFPDYEKSRKWLKDEGSQIARRLR